MVIPLSLNFVIIPRISPALFRKLWNSFRALDKELLQSRKFKAGMLIIMLSATSCSVVRATGKVVSTAGQAGCVAVKTTGKVAQVTTKAAYTTGKTVKTIVLFPATQREIPLEKRGNSMMVEVTLNRREKTLLVLDTGCSDTQISSTIARRLGIDSRKGEPILCRIANGRVVSGRAVLLKELRVGDVRLQNVRAIILNEEQTGGHDGLLGMSFLDHFVFKIDTQREILTLSRQTSRSR
jgi:clan AA aspartic protease (TIGR02281 family)